MNKRIKEDVKKLILSHVRIEAILTVVSSELAKVFSEKQGLDIDAEYLRLSEAVMAANEKILNENPLLISVCQTVLKDIPGVLIDLKR